MDEPTTPTGLTTEERAWYPMLRYTGPLINWVIRALYWVLWSWR